MDPQMRVSQADRQAAAQALQRHAAAGRLSQEELSERSEAAGRAVTHADLAAVTADLPAGGNPGWLSGNPVATGLIIAGIVVAILIALGLLSMVAMMAFIGPSMGWHCCQRRIIVASSTVHIRPSRPHLLEPRNGPVASS